MTIKQGVKYDSPESTREISAFIQFHNLKVDEILEPITSFSGWTPFLIRVERLIPSILETFNEFFYRYAVFYLQLPFGVVTGLFQQAEAGRAAC